MFKEEIIKEKHSLNAEYAQTIQHIENSTPKKKNTEESKKIFFEHPLKTLNLSPLQFQNRGYSHLQEQKTAPETIKADMNVQEDAHTLKDIQQNKLNLDLQK